MNLAYSTKKVAIITFFMIQWRCKVYQVFSDTILCFLHIRQDAEC